MTRVDTVEIAAGAVRLVADLRLPDHADALVMFAHGSGSSRFSPRNRQVAEALGTQGFATLLLDLLTADEDAIDIQTAELRFDISRLGQRLSAAIDWAATWPDTRAFAVGLFGASTGAAAALVAAAERPAAVRAVVSRGGRPDLATAALSRVAAPTLLIAGEYDGEVIALNKVAMNRLHAAAELAIVAGATHLFPEPGAMAEVIELAAVWFDRHLRGPAPGCTPGCRH